MNKNNKTRRIARITSLTLLSKSISARFDSEHEKEKERNNKRRRIAELQVSRFRNLSARFYSEHENEKERNVPRGN